MARRSLPLLLATLFAVQVLAISRIKRATAGEGGNAETAANSSRSTGGTADSQDVRGSTGAAGDARAAADATSAAPAPAPGPARRAYPAGARRAYEDKPSPKDLMQKKGKSRSTSSSSAEKDKKKSDDDDDDGKESLGIKASSGSSSDEGKGNNKKKKVPKSTEERHGWKKWHRKCYRCLEDEKMKWRDPRIKWVCGAYQRARRSFKSLCMMHYRNCQDGTMFVAIHAHRCANSSADDSAPHGEHFLYDYQVRLSDDSSRSKKTDDSSSAEESSSHSEN